MDGEGRIKKKKKKLEFVEIVDFAFSPLLMVGAKREQQPTEGDPSLAAKCFLQERNHEIQEIQKTQPSTENISFMTHI